jgi:hypothetical protein
MRAQYWINFSLESEAEWDVNGITGGSRVVQQCSSGVGIERGTRETTTMYNPDVSMGNIKREKKGGMRIYTYIQTRWNVKIKIGRTDGPDGTHTVSVEKRLKGPRRISEPAADFHRAIIGLLWGASKLDYRQSVNIYMVCLARMKFSPSKKQDTHKMWSIEFSNINNDRT